MMMNPMQPATTYAARNGLPGTGFAPTLGAFRQRRFVMKNMTLTGLALASLLMAGTAAAGPASNVADPQAPRALTAEGPVQVQWNDPAGFTELRYSRNRWEAQRGDWVTKLAEHLRKRATGQLPDGQQLAVTLTDIKRAGDYEPWHGPRLDDVRIMRDIYPPRMTVQFRRLDADGKVIAEGERKLSDPSYLMGIQPLNDSDPLRYEKRMIDSWVRREFADSTAAR